MEVQTNGSVTQTPWPARTAVSRTELDPVSFLHRSAAVHPDRIAVVTASSAGRMPSCASG